MSISADTQLPVVVIGGGIAGLAVAVALHSRGIPVRVFERDSRLSRRSYGLTMQAHGALAELGVLEGVLAADSACPSLFHWTFAANGRVLGYFGRAYRQSSDFSTTTPKGTSEAAALRGNLRIPREDLRQLLLDRLPSGIVQWGVSLEGFTSEPDAVVVTLSSQLAPVRARALIGADGIHSLVRRLMANGIRGTPAGPSSGDLRYLGVVLMLGLSSASHPLLERGGFYTLDGNGRARLFTMPYAPGVTMWQLSFAMTDGTEAAALCRQLPEALLAEALARTVNWHDPVRALIGASAACDVWATPLYDFGEETGSVGLPPGKAGAKGALGAAARAGALSRVTLVGDAAHPMSPFKGQGANQALRDGPALAAVLARAGAGAALPGALRAFEREMAARAGAKVLASRGAATALHTPSALNDARVVAGIDASLTPALLSLAAARGVGAASGAGLEAAFGALIAETREAAAASQTTTTPPPSREPLPAVSATSGALSHAAPAPRTHTLLYYVYADLGGEVRDEVAAWLRTAPPAGAAAPGVVGRVRCALDGLNATLGGPLEALQAHAAALAAHPLFADAGIDFKYAVTTGARMPAAVAGAHFDGFEVKLCQEIVTLQLPPGVAPASATAAHLSPAAFHAALAHTGGEDGAPAADVFIDCRNTYETDVGTFAAAKGVACLRPRTRTFAAFPKWVDEHRTELAGKTVLMACTGGVRCERASAYVREVLGAGAAVYQLGGGMHRYLEAAADGRLPGPSLWRGKLFVFDERPSVAPPAQSDVSAAGGAPSAAAVPEVLGRCCLCAAPHDEYAWLRCADCGVLVLVCDTCVATAGGPAAVAPTLACADCVAAAPEAVAADTAASAVVPSELSAAAAAAAASRKGAAAAAVPTRVPARRARSSSEIFAASNDEAARERRQARQRKREAEAAAQLSATALVSSDDKASTAQQAAATAAAAVEQ